MLNIGDILSARGARYNLNGTYRDHGVLTQKLKEAVRDHAGWSSLDPGHQEAIDMILHKIARVINGDPYYDDNWKDIQGYAKLAEDIKKEGVPTTPSSSFTFSYLVPRGNPVAWCGIPL